MEHSQSFVARSLPHRAGRRDRTEAVTELETAVASFQARLNDDQRTRLQSLKSTPHDIQAVVVFTAELDRADPKRRGKSIATRLSSFLQTIQKFFPAIDVFVSSNPELAALIWGSLKLTFLVLTNFTSYFESFVELLQGFSGLYARFSEYQLLYETYTELRDSVCRFNAAAIACCEHIVVVASRRMMKQAAKSLVTSFQSEMRQYINTVKAKADDVQRDIELVKAKADLNEQNARNKRYLGTAHWIFETQNFKDWCSLKDVPVLHVTGKIGSGKTILSSRVIEQLNGKKNDTDIVTFFFCRFNNSASLNCDTILRSHLYQLVSRPSLAKILKQSDIYRELEMAEDQGYSRESLMKLFRRSVRLVGKWFLILDGIDECTPEQRRWLFEFLSNLINHEETTWFSAPLQILTGSRQTSKDILAYAEDILREKLAKKELVLGDNKLAKEILESISLKEQGMFLWVFLSIEDICSQKSDRDIEKALETLPSELNSTIDRALERISLNNQAIAQAIFRWTAVVHQPLTVGQLREALSIDVSSKVINPKSRINGMERLNLWCENLVHIEEEDDTVCFAHQSIIDYLYQPDCGSWQDFHIDYEDSDHHAGQVCLTYLNLESPPTALEQTGGEGSSIPLRLPATNFPIATVVQQAMKEAVTANVGVKVGRLIDHAIQLREMSQSSQSSSNQALVDVGFSLTSNFSFLRYAEKHWHTHIRFLTPQSKSYPLLMGMLEGTLLAHKMPWMNEMWRTSITNEVARRRNIFLSEDKNWQYAILYADIIGSHDLIHQAVTISEQRNHLSGGLDYTWLDFLVDKGHLGCPRNCVAEVQKHISHAFLIYCITKYIAQGIPYWPALVTRTRRTCGCSEYVKQGAIHEDLVQVLAKGYSRSSYPLLQIFAGAYYALHTKEELVMLYRELNLTELDLLRARTITGKSILDIQAESKGRFKDETGSSPQLYLDILNRKDVSPISVPSGKLFYQLHTSHKNHELDNREVSSGYILEPAQDTLRPKHT
ncbi:hypothetical protein FBEOM_10377 [Fusarium beomiforme]|uniref:NACHT domain-containing protein n=1 Tax=Fusarium beomiforme TaxID=44412 RepID=A0A9P5DSQ0_9HYPO|nr:hypothetical protein FBEOM_10377 [Fusarium beomiforme]